PCIHSRSLHVALPISVDFALHAHVDLPDELHIHLNTGHVEWRLQIRLRRDHPQSTVDTGFNEPLHITFDHRARECDVLVELLDELGRGLGTPLRVSLLAGLPVSRDRSLKCYPGVSRGLALWDVPGLQSAVYAVPGGQCPHRILRLEPQLAVPREIPFASAALECLNLRVAE